MWLGVVEPLSIIFAKTGHLLRLFQLGLTTDVEQDLIMPDVANKTNCPYANSRPELPISNDSTAASKQEASNSRIPHGRSQGRQECSIERSIDEIDEDTTDGDTNMRFRTNRCAKWGDQGAVGIMA